MKTTVKISLIFNVLLAIGTVCFWKCAHNSQTDAEPASLDKNVMACSQSPTHNFPENQRHDFLNRTFHWSQLESSNNYYAYIANLRAAGCPEATVEDIVRGDTARAFALKRRELGLSSSGDGPWSRHQEDNLVDELLHGSSLPTNSQPLTQPSHLAKAAPTEELSRQQPTITSHSTIQPNNLATGGAPAKVPARAIENTWQKLKSRKTGLASAVPPRYPLVMQNVNWDSAGLTAGQKATVQQLRQQFIQAVGGAGQNPNDPSYLKRWRQAQPQSDLLFKAMLGITAWQNFQLMAADSGSPPANPFAAADASP